MDDSVKSIIKTLFYDAFPISSLSKSWESLTSKDWILFFRIFSLVGIVIQLCSVALLLIVIILPTSLSNTGILSLISTLFSRLLPLAAIILIVTYFISQPIEEIIGEEEPKRNIGSDIPFQLYFTGIAWIALSLFLRYSIHISGVSLIRDRLSETVGAFIGIFLFDSIYFGGMMFGIGIIAQTYTRRSLD